MVPSTFPPEEKGELDIGVFPKRIVLEISFESSMQKA
jgi:hypothetical protein